MNISNQPNEKKIKIATTPVTASKIFISYLRLGGEGKKIKTSVRSTVLPCVAVFTTAIVVAAAARQRPHCADVRGDGSREHRGEVGVGGDRAYRVGQRAAVRGLDAGGELVGVVVELLPEQLHGRADADVCVRSSVTVGNGADAEIVATLEEEPAGSAARARKLDPAIRLPPSALGIEQDSSMAAAAAVIDAVAIAAGGSG
jgi:hypothetical protein